MNKEDIIDYISTIVNSCIADGNTYLYAKCSPTIEEDSQKVPIGGGNFTVLLSTVATLEFLATIDALIDAKDRDFYSEEEIKKIKKKKEELEKNTLFKNLFRVPKEGDLKKGSGTIIREFIIKTSNLTGIDRKEAGKIQAIRNKLAHEFTPKIVPALGIPNAPGEDFVNLVSQYHNRPIFTLAEDNTIGIDSNALNHKLEVLLVYVIEKINRLSENDNKLLKVKNYIQKID